MRYLFVKKSLSWPRSSGHDVHTYYLMRSLARLGHEVALATVKESLPAALEGLELSSRPDLSFQDHQDDESPRLTWLQERFRSYWGVESGLISAIGRAAKDSAAEVVVVVGLDALPYLGAVEGATRVWYAGDEWVWHHLSQVRLTDPASWSNVRDAAVKGLYERAYAGLVDRAWVVSESDRRAMRPILGRDKVDVVPNGVDGDHFHAPDAEQWERSCVFWGRLDFGPNIQALEWFCQRVWPVVRRRVPDARFSIYGFNPTDRIAALASTGGVSVVPNLPDLRGEIARHQVVVLPFVSGGGIKNKLLEAASMAKAIICSPAAGNGLQGGGRAPLMVARSAGEWAEALASLWDDPGRRRGLGEQARRWVLENHSWEAAARAVAMGLAGPEGGGAP
jgi:glycosyltransferase involved in cell wall biosynthesis